MHWPTWWHILSALVAHALAQSAVPTMCQEESCRCDHFTRLICNCTRDNIELTLRPDGAYRVPSTATAIIINGCARVTFLPDTVRNLFELRKVELRNNNHVVVNNNGLEWMPGWRSSDPGLRITIDNCTVDEIATHAFKGRINDVIISDSRIVSIKPYAFSSLNGIKTIELTDNVYENIEIQAFKKFTTDSFVMRGGRVINLPSRFLSDVEVMNLFRMEGVTVKYLNSLSFLVNSPKTVLIESNNIETLEGDGFHVTSRGPITFRNNTISNLRKGAFYGLTIDFEVVRLLGPQELLIDNNTVTYLTSESFMYNKTSLSLRVDGLNINQSCSCELAETWQDMIKVQGGTISCWYSLESHYVSLPTYVDSRCGSFKQNFWIYVLIGVILILIVVFVAIYFIVRRENEKKKKKVQIVMPDGKTYRETEFHIVMERAELLTTEL